MTIIKPWFTMNLNKPHLDQLTGLSFNAIKTGIVFMVAASAQGLINNTPASVKELLERCFLKFKDNKIEPKGSSTKKVNSRLKAKGKGLGIGLGKTKFHTPSSNFM
jgi:hypothetical protein